MSVFEAIMLICFGTAWPVSIYKSWTSRTSAGKSVIFLYIVLIGYAAGVTHKVLYSRDWIIALYALNGLMVFIDILLYYRNARLKKATEHNASPAGATYSWPEVQTSGK